MQNEMLQVGHDSKYVDVAQSSASKLCSAA